MFIKSYYGTGSCEPLWKQNCIVGKDGDSEMMPIIYLQRPRWVTDDAMWNVLCKSIRLDLPIGFELK